MPDHGEQTELQLMLRVRDGDMAAFERLHDRYQHRMLQFFWMLSRDPHAAAELAQETFLRVWKVRKRYRATGSFAGYLFGIARMIWLERRRAHAYTARLGRACPLEEAATRPSTENTPDRAALGRELSTLIFAALEQLPEEQRVVFVMRSIEGLALDEIAEALDCPVNTVRSRRLLALKKLRHLLADAVAEYLPRSAPRPSETTPIEEFTHELPSR
jgi:RNA polymerase sigma-70 factor (ECF subfamily)